MVKTYLDITELSIELNLINKKTGKPANHILRFWEKEFSEIRPTILKGNRRYYDQSNIDLLKKIKFLLKDQGMTINGVKKVLNSTDSNNLDEILNKTIRADNLKIKIKNFFTLKQPRKQITKPSLQNYSFTNKHYMWIE